MSMQGTWLRAQARYAWIPAYYLIVLVYALGVLAAIYSLPPARVGRALAATFPAALVLRLAVMTFIALKPFQSEVTFMRGHAFCRAGGIRAGGFVKPSRATRSGFVIDVRNSIRGFQMTFQNEQDANIFTGWCRESGVPTAQGPLVPLPRI